MHNERTHRYFFGLRLFGVAKLALSRIGIRERAAPFLWGLMERTNLTVHLAIHEQGEGVIVEKVEPHSLLRIHSWIGNRWPLHCSGFGKVLLAYLPEGELVRVVRERGLTRYNENTITSMRRLQEEVARIRRAGYAVEEEEGEIGFRCIGCPIFDHNGEVIAAISLAGTTIQITADNLSVLADELKRTAQAISGTLGYTPDQPAPQIASNKSDAARSTAMRNGRQSLQRLYTETYSTGRSPNGGGLMQPFHIDGVVPVIPTPFTTSEEIQWDALGTLLDFAAAAGACAVCLPAYASEFYKLSEDERNRLVSEAVGHAGQELPVIAQVNGPTAQRVAACAAKYQELGASAIAVAVPRLFPLPDRDLWRYFDRVLKAIDIPLIIQDFHPGGPTISSSFIASLHREHAHFRYVKLEEAMMAAKVETIVQETGGEVGVLEGWGGMYLLELMPAGIAGVVPGLAISDLLVRVYRLAQAGRSDEAFAIFQGILPQIVYSLQNMELFHHAEKRLLEARGLLANSTVREPRLQLLSSEDAHIQFLNTKVLDLLERTGLPRNPAPAFGSAHDAAGGLYGTTHTDAKDGDARGDRSSGAFFG